MTFKSVRVLFAASMLLVTVGCEGSSLFMREPTPTPSPTATPAPTHTPAPTPTMTPSPVPRQLILGSVPSPDGQWMAVVDDVGVCVYDVTSYGEVWRAPVTGLVEDMYFDQVQIAWADDSTAFTVSIGKVVYETERRSVSHLSRFDAASGRLLWQQSFEDRPNVTFSPDGNRFLLASMYSDAAELWDGLAPERTGALELPPYAVLTLPRTRNWSPDGLLIAGKLSLTSPTPAARITEGILSFTEGRTEERSIFVWDAVTGKLVTKLRDSRQGSSFHRLGWARDGSTLISDENGRFILWDTETWSYRSQILYDARFNSASIEPSPDGTRLVSLLQHRGLDIDTRFAIYAWELPSGKPLPAAGGALLSAPKSNPLNFVGWTPDGNSCLYKVDGQIVTLDVDVTQGQVGEPFPIPEWDLSAWTSVDNYYYIDHYQLSADGKHIYFVEPKAVTVYDAQTGEVIARLTD